MPDNNNFNDDFDWEELLRRTSAPGRDRRAEPAAPQAGHDEAIRQETTADAEPVQPQKPGQQEVRPVQKPAGAPVKRPVPPRKAEPEKPADDADDEEFDYENERDYLPIKPRRDGRIGCLGGLMYAVFVISISIILACMAWMFASDVLALNKPEVTATVTLPKTIFTETEVDKLDDEGNVVGKSTVQTADMDYVATQLKDAGIIEYKFLFKLFSLFSHADTKLDPGTYELSTAFDYRALVKKMTAGSPSQMTTKITFPEGYTMEQIFSLLEEKDICSKDDLYEAAANSQFSYTFVDESKMGDAKRLEGYLFPDTYEFYEGERAYSVINKFLYNFYYRRTARHDRG